jgi:phosphoglycerate dehydrogenase-like enzyme
VLDTDALDWIYPLPLRHEIMQLVDMPDEPVTAVQVEADPTLLADVELLFSGWRAPYFTNEMINAAANLKAIFYGAGTTDYFICDAIKERNIMVTSSIADNSLPVVEFTVAQIVLCLKRVWQHVLNYKTTRIWNPLPDGPSCYGSTVGLISLGQIGSLVAERLAAMDVRVLAYDIHHNDTMSRLYRVQYVSLQELFALCDVVSIHTPVNNQTRGMITGQLLNTMKQGGCLINTARGEILEHEACNQVWASRSDLLAVLDVTDPEPLPENSILFDLPNVVLTPHIAGSRGRECERMGRTMLRELKRYLSGQPLLHGVSY